MNREMNIDYVLRYMEQASRRDVLRSALAFSILSLTNRGSRAAVHTRRSFADDPFRLGVASGDPSADGAVLWTRLAPDPLNGGGLPPENIRVGWEVAEDDSMQHIVCSGSETADARLAHSVHVEVRGLQPDRWYFYRFHAGDAVSPVGRLRTTPERHVQMERLRFCFASCQHYEHGYYHAWRHMREDSPDLVIHLGDYIYEGAASGDRVRRHNSDEIISLDDYRNRHALYRTDPDLQAAHAMCPWLITWDDHEFDNNYAGEISEEPDVDPEQFLKRRAAAYQAWYEHMPVRRTAVPRGPHARIYRSVPFGTLAEFDVLDTRQFRSDQPCGDRRVKPCADVSDPQATMLGERQESWLRSTLQKSPAVWNILAQQVMMARVDRDPGDGVIWSYDQWAGYDIARRRLLRFLQEARISGPVVLTGDIHNHWVNDLKIDFDSDRSPVVATEFVGTSISSGGNGSDIRSDTPGVLRDNPFVKFFSNRRGYVCCTVTPDCWQSDYRVLDTVTQPESQCRTAASFVVTPDQPGAERA